MSVLAGLFPPGTDLCALPAAYAPEGETYNLVDPPTMKSLTISLTVILTAIALLFTVGRLFANIRKTGRPTIADGLVTLAILCNIAEGTLMIYYSGTFRHMWTLPLCLIDEPFIVTQYLFEILNSFGLLFSKTATLLLFYQIFTISDRMRIAIRIALVANIVIYLLTICVMTYYTAPHAGQTWAEDALTMLQPGFALDFRLWYSVAQGAVSTIWDFFVFILPLPIVLRLNLSTSKRIQIGAVFFTAFLGIVASVVSLGFRGVAARGSDSTWTAGILMNCNLAEMNIASIIASTPGFASFLRRHVATTKLYQNMRIGLGLGPASASSTVIEREKKRDPNQPRTGRDENERRRRLRGPYSGLYDLWSSATKTRETANRDGDVVEAEPQNNDQIALAVTTPPGAHARSVQGSESGADLEKGISRGSAPGSAAGSVAGSSGAGSASSPPAPQEEWENTKWVKPVFYRP